jgi:NAD-dependent deacetylase
MVEYPAAGVVNYVKAEIPIYVVDKRIPSLPNRKLIIEYEEDATTGMEKLFTLLTKK